MTPRKTETERLLNSSKLGHSKGTFRRQLQDRRRNINRNTELFPKYFNHTQLLSEVWYSEFEDLQTNSYEIDKLFPALLCVNAYMHYLSAMELALSACTQEAWTILRGAIESCVYSQRIIRNPQLALVWAEKHLGKEQEKSYTREFEKNKAELLFSPGIRLKLLHVLYRMSSEYATHATVAALLQRLDLKNLDRGVIRVEQFETDESELEGVLFGIFIASSVIESFSLEAHEQRAGINLGLRRKRARILTSFGQVFKHFRAGSTRREPLSPVLAVINSPLTEYLHRGGGEPDDPWIREIARAIA